MKPSTNGNGYDTQQVAEPEEPQKRTVADTLTSDTLSVLLKIEAVTQKIERLKGSLPVIRSSIQDMIENVITERSKDEAHAICKQVYWSDQRLDKHVYAAFKKVFGEPFHPGYVMFETTCNKCGKLFDEPCQSWRGIKRHWCGQCKREEQERYRRDNSQVREESRTKHAEEMDQIIKENEEYKLQQLRTMPYKEYLQTWHWKNLRDEMLRRAKFRCQLCNAKGRMNVHHRTYERRGCEWVSDLIVLCVPCHEKHHDIFRGDDR